jgi:hypothetical protein
LGAYRRDDWLPTELDQLGEHLSGCAECRRREAIYRQAGEGIRQLPTMTPPDSFRASVFAAIRAEDARAPRSIERLANEETHPGMPALRPDAHTAWTRRPFALGTRSAIAVAAVLLLSLFSARLLPAVARGVPALSDYLSGAPFMGPSAGPQVAQYRVPLAAGRVASAMATSRWVVYVVTDVHGAAMVYARDRASSRTLALTSTPHPEGITLRGVTDHWAIWQSGAPGGAGPWELWASPLGTQGTPIALTDSAATSTLSGVWSGANTVLVAEVTAAGESAVVRYDLTSGQVVPAQQVIAHAQTPGHLLADPSLDGGHYYWAEVWYDTTSGLRSDVWQGTSAAGAQRMTNDGTAFAPHTNGHMLIWVDVHGPVAVNAWTAAQPAQSSAAALWLVTGAVRAHAMPNGAERQLGGHALAETVQVAGQVVLWGDGARMHTYDLARGEPATVDAQLQQSGFASANDTSLAWGQVGSSTIEVYDAD